MSEFTFGVIYDSLFTNLPTYLDYCIAAFAVIIIISVFQWFVDGSKNFTGPRTDITIDALDTVPAREEMESSMHEKELSGRG